MKKEITLIRMSTNGNNRRKSDACREVKWTIEETPTETRYYTEDEKVYIRRHEK